MPINGGSAEGFEAVFLPPASQKIFEVTIGENITPENTHKKISKEMLIRDIEQRGQVSEFFPFKERIQVFEFRLFVYFVKNFAGTDLLLILDEDAQLKRNYVLCVTQEAIDSQSSAKKALPNLMRESKRKESKADAKLAPLAPSVSQIVTYQKPATTEQGVKEEAVFPNRELVFHIQN